MTQAGYYDKRSEFWEHHWNIAQDYEAYLGRSKPEEMAKWIESEQRIPALSEEQRSRVRGYGRELRVLLYGGIWCGDCQRQGAILKRIVEACGKDVKLRIIERDASKELQDELRILGALRTPVAVFLSEDWWEVDRFGDRTLSVYRSRAAREIGRGEDLGVLSPNALAIQLEEWVEVIERVLLMLRLAPLLRKRHGD